MSCKDFEQNIYVYAELSTKERSHLDAHLQTCPLCSSLFQEVQQTQQLIHQVAKEKPMPPHAARLTASIMSKIARPSKRAFAEWISELLLSKKSKFALSVLSSALLLVFCIQSFDDPSQFKPSQTASSFTNTVILNARLFRENFSRHKEKRTLFADCRSPLQSNQYYLNCVKSKLK